MRFEIHVSAEEDEAMSEPTVTVRLTLYEVDDKDNYWPGGLFIQSHWNDPARVVIEVANHRYTVLAEDLADAAQRARKPR